MSSQMDFDSSDLRKKILLFAVLAIISFFLTAFIFFLIGLSMGVSSDQEGLIFAQQFLWPFMGWWFYPMILIGTYLVFVIIKKTWLESIELNREKFHSKRLLARKIQAKK
ncbi:MAG: hypothetical protein ACFFBD_23750 [Candidatus Hodarchaeota archaeon]